MINLRATNLFCKQPCSRPVVREDLVFAVPNKGNGEVLLNGDDMDSGVVLFERGEVRSEE